MARFAGGCAPVWLDLRHLGAAAGAGPEPAAGQPGGERGGADQLSLGPRGGDAGAGALHPDQVRDCNKFIRQQ